jgi:peptidoglycan/xylan/chitin deacetylase (PgdA/CDA1 family)
MYHRIAEPQLDPWRLCVTPSHFAEHLDVLARSAHTVSLRQLLHARRGDGVAPRTAALTFDDGYVDNLCQAKPLLERYEAPATVFVASASIGSGRGFWWDELERVLLRPGRLPTKLDLEIGGSLRQWTLASPEYTAHEYARDRGRNPWEAGPGSRLWFYYSIWKELRPLSPQRLSRCLDEILAWAGIAPRGDEACRPLNGEELRDLARGSGVEIGAHTRNHVYLPAHPAPVQRTEIEQCKADLEVRLGAPVTSFAYPYGESERATVDLVRAAGYSSACTTVHRTVGRDVDCFQLPRFAVPDCDGRHFARYLASCFRC